MVQAVRRGASMRQVADQFGVALATVQRWVARAVTGSRKARKAIGSAKSGEVEDSTLPTPTPAYFSPATKLTELRAVRTPSHAMRRHVVGPCRHRSGRTR